MTNGIAVPTVHILLATYQGQRYLQEQLESIARQTYTRWTLTVSDDGSTDDTLAIVQRFVRQTSQAVSVITGPQLGATRNFLHLVQAATSDRETDLFAFCDQDDVWLPEKLNVATRHWLAHGTAEKPYLYCGRIQVTDATLRPLRLSKPPARPLTFGNALTQNVANGNTMVFNRQLLLLLKKIRPEHAVWHDWAAYQAATGCDGTVYYDCAAYVLYRHHADNVIGGKQRLLDRARAVFGGRYRRWGDLTELAMQDISHALSPQARATLRGYHQARHALNPLDRLRGALSAGIERQSPPEQAIFLASVALGLI